MKDIAEEMGVSSTTVNKYLKNAIRTLKRHRRDLGITFIPSLDKIEEEDRKKNS